MRYPLILTAALLFGCGGGEKVNYSHKDAEKETTQEIPDHPDKLKFEPLKFDVPDRDKLRIKLSNGTPVYYLEDKSLPMVNIDIFVRTGSFWDPEGKEGTASFTGRLMRIGGTSSRGANEIDEELDFLAAQLSVSLGDEFGSASLSVLGKDLDKGLDILVDVLRNPTFDEKKLGILKSQVMEGLKARNDSTNSIEGREAQLLFYGDGFAGNRHATGKSVAAIEQKDLIAYHRNYFHPKNFVVAVAGAVAKEEILTKLEKAFADWPKGGVVTNDIPLPKHEPKSAVYTFNKDGVNQGRVTIGHMGLSVNHPDVQTMRLMSYIFGGGGFSSRLVQKVRTEEGLAYSVYSDFRATLNYPRPFIIRFQSKSESCAYAAKLCLEELKKLQEEGPTEKELKAAIQFYQDAFPAFFFSNPHATVSTFARAEVQRYPEDYYTSYRERIARCTIADVKRVANEHLKPENFIFMFVGDVKTMSTGDGKHDAKLEDFGEVINVPLPDPVTLERPKP